MKNKREYLLPTTMMALTALTGLALSAPSASADSSGTVALTVDVPASCSLTVNPSSHTVTINPGNTGLIGTSTIKSICNDPAGLAVYAVGYTNDTYGNNNLSSTVGANTINIATAVTPSGTPSTSEWNMTLTAISGDYTPEIVTGFTQAHIIPDVYTKVAYRNTMTDIGTNATGAQFTASFNAYIAPTQAAGTYEGKVKFLLVHPNVLTYDSQTGEPATTQPTTLPCEPAEYDTFDSSVTHYLQDVAEWKNQVALNQEVTVYDSRDNQAYKVKRLKMSADGCQTALWMSNLNLGAVAFASGVTELNSTNTHLASGVSAIPVTTFNYWIKTSGTDSFNIPELIPITVSNSSDGQTEDSYGNKYGTLYNYSAATAGTYTYSQGAGTDSVASDLCPAGWRMPTGNTTGEIQALIDAYGISNGSYGYSDSASFVSIQQDLGFPLAGYFRDGAPNYQGTQGYYWTTTFNSGSFMYDLIFYDSYLNPASSSSRRYGNPIRCIAQ